MAFVMGLDAPVTTARRKTMSRILNVSQKVGLKANGAINVGDDVRAVQALLAIAAGTFDAVTGFWSVLANLVSYFGPRQCDFSGAEATMGTVDFKFGTLIRTGPRLANGGKWDADLVDWKINPTSNAYLTIFIRIFFAKIDPAGQTGRYGDADDTAANPSKKPIQKWKPGEFERYVRNLTSSAQRFWDGQFWLKTPKTYNGLNTDGHPPYRCNIYCKFDLKAAPRARDAHYTIAVVRAQDGVDFRSHSVLFSQNDIKSEQMIPHSTVKFWTHFHEVGHLIGLGHVGTGGRTNVHNDNSATAYGVTAREMQDVMGRGHSRHNWHATPWQQAAEAFTGVRAADWGVFQQHIAPQQALVR